LEEAQRTGFGVHRGKVQVWIEARPADHAAIIGTLEEMQAEEISTAKSGYHVSLS
jgi:hypothetical protein